MKSKAFVVRWKADNKNQCHPIFIGAARDTTHSRFAFYANRIAQLCFSTTCHIARLDFYFAIYC